MVTVTTPNNVSQALVAAREAAADALVRGYGETKRYAGALSDEFGSGWYEFKGDNAKPVALEKAAFYTLLKQGGHTNPSVAWGRIVAAAKAADAPEDAGIGANHTRSLSLRLIEELTKLHKAGLKAEGKSTKEMDALTYVNSALAALGIDTSTLA